MTLVTITGAALEALVQGQHDAAAKGFAAELLTARDAVRVVKFGYELLVPGLEAGGDALNIVFGSPTLNVYQVGINSAITSFATEVLGRRQGLVRVGAGAAELLTQRTVIGVTNLAFELLVSFLSAGGDVWTVTLGPTPTLSSAPNGYPGVRPVGPDPMVAADPIHLVELEVFVPPVASYRLPQIAMGAGVLGGWIGASWPQGTTIQRRWSDSGWIGEPDDPTPEVRNVYYGSRVMQAGCVTRVVPIVPEGDRGVSIQWGGVEFANADRGLDADIAAGAGLGRPITIRRGARCVPIHAPYTSFGVVGRGIATGWTAQETTATLDVRGPEWGLSRPLQQRHYGGTGGADGPAELMSKPMPLCFGFRRNISGDSLDAVNGVYRVHSRAIRGVVAARDAGSPLVRDNVDHASYDGLIAAQIATGHYQECRSLGIVRCAWAGTSTSPRFDVEGDAANGYFESHSALAIGIISGFAGVTNADVDIRSAISWPNGRCGLSYRSDEAPTCSDAVGRLAGSVGGFVGAWRDGRIRLGRLILPSGSPVMTINPWDLRGPIKPLLPPSAPRWRQAVGYRQLANVQTLAEIGALVANREQYTIDHQSVSVGDAQVKAAFPDAVDPATHVSLFDDAADANALAQHLLALHGTRRLVFSVPLGPAGYGLEIGDCILLCNPSYGLSAGRLMIVTGDAVVSSQTEDTVTINVWG